MVFFFSGMCIISKTAGIIHRQLLPNHIVTVRHIISLPVEWRRPGKIDFWDPLKSGDGVTKLEVDWDKSPKLVEQSKEMETADETIKQLFTFRYMGRRYAMRRCKEDMVDSVKNHDYDQTSMEVLVAKRTATIRNLMEHCENYTLIHGAPWGVDKKARKVMHHNIMRRHKLLRKLRQWDYKKYEWVLEKLDLYHTGPPTVPWESVDRKPSIRKLTDKYCDSYKQRKLDAYKAELEGRRAEFFTRKIESLKCMRQTEIECGVEPTITEDDIRHAEEQLNQHLETLKEQTVTADSSSNILDRV